MTHVRYRQELIHDGRRYFWAYAALAIEPFLLVPLLLSVLAPAEIGVLGAVEAMVVALGGLSQLGVKFAYLQHVADRGEDDRGRGFWTAAFLTTAAGFAAGAAAAPLLDLPVVAGLLGMPAGISWATLGALLLATNLQMMLVTDLRARRAPMPFVVASLVRVVAVVLLVRILTGRMSSGVEAVLLAQVAALGLSASVLIASGGMPRRSTPDAGLAKVFLAYGWPIALVGLVKYATDALLPWFCLALVSPVAVGALALALKTSALFDAWFGLPFLMAWGGRVYHLANEKTVAMLSRRLFTEVALAALLAGAMAWLAGWALLRIAMDDPALRLQALTLLPLAVAGRVLFVLRSPASVGQVAARTMHWHFRYALAGLVAAVVLAPVTFRVFGAAGGWMVFLGIEAASHSRCGLRQDQHTGPPAR